MKFPCRRLYRNLLLTLLGTVIAFYFPNAAVAQNEGVERTFPQSKTTVEQALKTMQNSAAGRLPVLDGFATAADHPLERYRRGYYQSKIQVSSTPSGGSIVRVKAEVTAWYNDPAGHSGYQVLTSNGRLEADFLDQLADQLAAKAEPPVAVSPQKSETAAVTPAPVAKTPAPVAKTPAPRLRLPPRQCPRDLRRRPRPQRLQAPSRLFPRQLPEFQIPETGSYRL